MLELVIDIKVTLKRLHFKGRETILVLELQIKWTTPLSLPMEVQCKWQAKQVTETSISVVKALRFIGITNVFTNGVTKMLRILLQLS